MGLGERRKIEELKNTNSRPILETLEPRQLLSAAPVANPSAAHRSHPTAPPLILGIYPGDYTNTKTNATGALEMVVISQTSSNKFFGTAVVLDNYYKGSGTINSKGRFSFHGSVNHQSVRATGTATPDGTILVGKFSFTQKHASFKATFSADRSAIDVPSYWA
jgi:hypothetical protein